MQAHVSRSFLAKNCIFTHLSFEIETEKKFPLLLPSHNCIIITMFSFQGTWWNLLETPGGDKRDRTADLMTASCDRFVILSVFASNTFVPSAENAEFHSNFPIASTRFRAHLGQNLGQGSWVDLERFCRGGCGL